MSGPIPIKVKNKKNDFTCFLPEKYEKMSFFKKKFQNPFFLHIKVPETYTCTSEYSDSKWERLGHFRKKVSGPPPDKNLVLSGEGPDTLFH